MVGNKLTLNIWQALKRFTVEYTKPAIIINKNDLLFLQNEEVTTQVLVFRTGDNKTILLPSSAKEKTVTRIF